MVVRVQGHTMSHQMGHVVSRHGWTGRAGRAGRVRRAGRAGIVAVLAATLAVASNAAAVAASGPPIVRAVDVGGQPTAIAIDPATHRVYVACVTPAHGNQLRVIDGPTNRVIASMPLGLDTIGALAIDPVAGVGYAVDINGRVQLIGLAHRHVLAAISTGDTDGLDQVAVNPRSGHAYISNPVANTVTVIDTRTRSRVRTLHLRQGGGLYAQAIAVDPATDTVFVALGGGDVDVIDGRTNRLQATVHSTDSVHAATTQLAVNPRTDQVYLSKDDGGARYLVVLDGRTLRFTGRIALLNTSADFTAIDPRTDTMYASSADFSNIAVIGLRARRLRAVVNPGATYPEAEPWGLATDPGRGRTYIDNNFGTNVFVLAG
jgi:DNA-binding beta-propeller fold protein YncE